MPQHLFSIPTKLRTGVKTKTSTPTQNADAEHNFPVLLNLVKNYYPKPYELKDSHNQYTPLDDLFFAIVVPDILSETKKKTIYPVLLVTTTMLKTTVSLPAFRILFEAALKKATLKIEEERWIEQVD